MNYLLKYILVAFCMLWCPALMAQTQATFSINETIQTPQTQSFVRYGNNPVDLYTGTTGVSIPVYTYKDNDFEIPISLEYASSGLIANHQTGILGQGWYLNTGGGITRTVVGIPDENFTNAMAGYHNYHSFVPVDENIKNPLLRGKPFHSLTTIDEPFVYLYNPSSPSSSMYESTPDIFHFNFMGYQGSFQFDVNKRICIYNTNTARDNFKIKVSNFQNRTISSFEITTHDGYKYIFGGTQFGLYDRECNIVEKTAEQTVISWQLTKIIASNGRKVSFKYRSGDYMSRGIVKNMMPSSDYMIVSTQSGGLATYYESSTVSQFPTYLESILVEDVCRIQLDYTAKESEKYGTDRGLRDLPPLLKLSSVTVNSLSPSLEQILHCDLGYEYTGKNKTLFLKEVNFGEGKIYKMKYIGVDGSPSLAAFPLNNTCAVDHWGYYNGKSLTSINNFIPSTTTDKKDKEVITSEQRESDPIYSQLGMLKRISYPTGGYTVYEYEGNTYSRRAMDRIYIRSVAVDKQAGGVRIKTISDYTETGECNRREFTYQNSDGTSSGILLKMPRYRLNYTMVISNHLYYINRGNAQDMSTYSLEGAHIEYARIVEKKSDGSMTEYKYKNSFDPFIGDNTQVDAQDLTFIPNQRINSSNSGMARFLLSRLHSNAYKRGLLESLYTTINGKTVYSEEYSYLNPEGKKYPAPGYQTAIILNVKTAGDVFYIDQINAVNKAQVGLKTTKEYINEDVFTTQKEYKFESSCGRLNCIATTLSNGDILRERIEYPEDMKAPTDIEKMMVDSFLISMPARKALTIQKKPTIWSETVETVISGEYNKYKKYGKLIKLEEVRKTAYDQLPQWKDFNLDFIDSDFHNDTYDSWGNLTQQTAKDGRVTSYVWGYNNRYPVTIEKNGLKTRYEYKPLIGITSVTDIRGIKTYYEYDKAGRLQCVKDNDKNIVSRYDYHYDSLNINRSFIHTQTMLSANADFMLQEFQYFDGLGKPVQTVSQGISPTKGDLVSASTYDSMGRISKQWLPLHVQGNNGAFLSDPFNNIVKQYADNAPYQHTEYDHLPESRIILQQDAGEAWKKNPVLTHYLTNETSTALNCIRYQVNDEGTLHEEGAYNPGELRVMQSTDEDGKSSYTFTDKEDRTVLIREMDGAKQHDTHYVYDIKGNLCYVLSPMYQESQDLSLYAYQYSYDNRNRCIMKKMPGGNLTRYAYDKAGRLICYQDRYQQQYSKWIFSIPDQKGREVIKGISLSSSINVPPISNTLVYAERYQGEGSMKSGYIIHDLLGMLNTESKEVNYYDDYSFLSDFESTDTRQSLKFSFEDFPSWLKNKEKEFSALSIEPVGLQSGKRFYLDNNTYLLTAIYYDKKGRIVQKRGTNHLGGYDIYFYSYTFTGLTKGHVHLHLDSNKKTVVAEYYNYEYDGGERLKQVIYRLNGGQEIVLAENEYDNLCRLKSMKLNNGVSTLNYEYNIRDWMTSIDSPIFKQKLHYTDGAGTPCYNGNLSSITWQTASSGISGYKFSYDDLNRMKDAIYGEGNKLNENLNRFNEQITGYDKNGNILGLKRFGQTSQNDYGLIDDLLLSHTGNRLLAVKDNAVNSAYAGNFEFLNGADKSVEYNYDVSGNLKNNLNKKITDIQYNYLNLPSLIKFENGSNISYLYSPEGAKLRTTHVTDKDTLITDYCGNVIYENEIPVKLLTEVGYVTLTDAVHHYFLQDHQGNNRVVIDDKNNVEEVNHYYPFGGVFASTSSVQPFKYNGKELDRRNGLDWYDYGARMYDAALGRFTTSDPSAENYYGSSPYTYCGNNPVTRIDPNGKDWIEDPYGGLLWDVTAISRETTRKGWSYVGTTLPEDANRYRILEEINGKLYHKNTINPLASLVNAIAGEDIMVEKKAYDPVEDHMMQQAIETGAEMAVGEIGGKIAGKVASKFLKPKGTNVVYQGKDANNIVRYVGITERDPLIRFAEHSNSGTLRATLNYKVINGAKNLTRSQARIIEQTLINKYGLGKNGGQLFNKINSISPNYWKQFGIK